MKLHFDKYLNLNVCNTIKGFFILTVFYSHIMPYLRKGGVVLDNPLFGVLNSVSAFLGQLIVVMFLFYSGYGVMYSIAHKGDNYVKAMPRRRLWTTLLNFMVAVAIFLLLQTAVLHNEYALTHIALSLIGWNDVGNSNWYIFVILLCYTVTYLIYKCLQIGGGKTRLWATVCILLLCIPVLAKLKPSWWYDTLAAYPLGMIWFAYKENIEKFLTKHFLLVLLTALTMFTIYELMLQTHLHPVFHNVRSMLFAIVLVQFTLLVPISMSAFTFLGKNLFALYIYQRLPMIYLSRFDDGFWMNTHPYIYLLACAAITLAIVPVYNLILKYNVTGRIQHLLYPKA